MSAYIGDFNPDSREQMKTFARKYFNKSIRGLKKEIIELENFDFEAFKLKSRNHLETLPYEPHQIPKEVDKRVKKRKRYLESKIDNLHESIEDLENKLENLKKGKYNSSNDKPIEVKKKKDCEFYWHKVGVLFATGKLNEYFDAKHLNLKEGYSFPKIAKKLGDKKYSPWIWATFTKEDGEDNKRKNIYNSLYKMDEIIKYCKENKLEVDNHFLDKYTLLKGEQTY